MRLWFACDIRRFTNVFLIWLNELLDNCYCSNINAVLADDVASENQNNNAVIQRSNKTASSDHEADHDDDSVDGQETQHISSSNLNSSSSIFSSAVDRSPLRKKRKQKSLERLTQIKQEEVSFVYSWAKLKLWLIRLRWLMTISQHIHQAKTSEFELIACGTRSMPIYFRIEKFVFFKKTMKIKTRPYLRSHLTRCYPEAVFMKSGCLLRCT